MITAIITAEIAFWVFLLGGLTLRYVLRRRRASAVALTAVPLVDLALVTFVGVDVARGGHPAGHDPDRGSPVAPRPGGCAQHPYWATLQLLGIITVIWFLAGPAFAGVGDPSKDLPTPRDTQRSNSSDVQVT